MKQNENSLNWTLPGWSWRKELGEVAKCLALSLVLVGVLAMPTKMAFDAIFADEPVAGETYGVKNPESSAHTGNAARGGGVNSDGDVGPYVPMAPDANEIGNGTKNPHKDPNYDPVNTGIVTLPSEKRDYMPEEPSVAVVDVDKGYVDNGEAPDLKPLKPVGTTGVDLKTGEQYIIGLEG